MRYNVRNLEKVGFNYAGRLRELLAPEQLETQFPLCSEEELRELCEMMEQLERFMEAPLTEPDDGLKIKTHLLLTQALRTRSEGGLSVTMQLVEAPEKGVIGAADFTDGLCTAIHVRDSAVKDVRLRRKIERLFQVQAEECAQFNSVKSLEWAYPSSENAAAFDFKATGCWVIELGLPSRPLHAVAAFAPDEKEYALNVARRLPFTWLRSALHHHSEYEHAAEAFRT